MRNDGANVSAFAFLVASVLFVIALLFAIARFQATNTP